MSAPPPDLDPLARSIGRGALFMLGLSLPLLCAAMVPPRRRLAGAAVVAVVGIGVFLRVDAVSPGPLGFGILLGVAVASLKLLTGIRFL